MAVFLVAVGILTSAWFFKKTGVIEVRGVFGGPDSPTLLQSAEGAELNQPAALGVNTGGALVGSNPTTIGDSGVAFAGAALPDEATMKDLGTPVGPAFDRSGLISYTVQQGDNLSKIASYFGISISTIISANPGVKANMLSAGQTLKILPTSGVVYKTQSGDTLQSIADAFGITQDKITQFNPSVDFSTLDPGMSVIIPGGKESSIMANAVSLPNFNSDFMMPTDGYNWGTLHHYNAVDIANSCGTPVVAAAEGLVIPDDSIPDTTDGWNEGYGNFVLIEHPFGDNVRTRYAHLEKILVQVGDYVKQGQVIGLMGQTGDATGCHVHFEVIGAQNPFAKS